MSFLQKMYRVTDSWPWYTFWIGYSLVGLILVGGWLFGLSTGIWIGLAWVKYVTQSYQIEVESLRDSLNASYRSHLDTINKLNNTINNNKENTNV